MVGERKRDQPLPREPALYFREHQAVFERFTRVSGRQHVRLMPIRLLESSEPPHLVKNAGLGMMIDKMAPSLIRQRIDFGNCQGKGVHVRYYDRIVMFPSTLARRIVLQQSGYLRLFSYIEFASGAEDSARRLIFIASGPKSAGHGQAALIASVSAGTICD